MHTLMSQIAWFKATIAAVPSSLAYLANCSLLCDSSVIFLLKFSESKTLLPTNEPQNLAASDNPLIVLTTASGSAAAPAAAAAERS